MSGKKSQKEIWYVCLSDTNSLGHTYFIQVCQNNFTQHMHTYRGFKDPENMLVLPFLALEFPNAAILHIVRDGRDVAVSNMPMHTHFLGFARKQRSELIDKTLKCTKFNLYITLNLKHRTRTFIIVGTNESGGSRKHATP